MDGHIYIQGIISPWQDKAAEDWGEVNIKQVTQQLQNNADAEKLVVHIHSPGGDVTEGFGIYDLIVAWGKDNGVSIETRIEGLCASIATVIALAGETRYMTENSDFMIHAPFGWADGNADELQQYADQLKAVEDKILDFYVAKTGTDRESITAMMDKDTWLTADQAKELGFITDIITTIKAVAIFKPKNENIMNAKELEKSIDTKFNGFLEKIKAMLNLSGAKALTVTSGDGTVLDFGDQVESVDEIEVGMTATIEGGGTPEGEYVMPDGKTFVFDAGTLTEIQDADAGGDEMTLDEAKAKISELEQQLADANAKNEANETAIQGLQKSFKELKAEIHSDISTFTPEGNRGGASGDPENRFEGLKEKRRV